MSVMESKITEPMMESNIFVLLNKFCTETNEYIAIYRLSYIANALAESSDFYNHCLAWFCFEQYYLYFQGTDLLVHLIILAVDALEKDRILLTSIHAKLEKEKSSLKNHGQVHYFQRRASDLLIHQRELYEMLCRQFMVVMSQLEGSPYHYIEYDNVAPPNSEYDSDLSSKQSQEEIQPLNLSKKEDSSERKYEPDSKEYFAQASDKIKKRKPMKQVRVRKYKCYPKEYLAQALHEIKMGKPVPQVIKQYTEIPSRTIYERSKKAREQAIKQL
ncbi:uncharacterized protein LOC106652314 [Trichogramma pretiosum]|uniref:uncharacterized protein LOC106652314 n=1 Tax=Trichogramma pretiosum TaxID=7493 RepID=UPI0006C9AB40|nr:uncharacterized protein LOC106652314 [Trichogramma pretiosum]